MYYFCMHSLNKFLNLKMIIFVQFCIFLPFLLQGNIGSDWDSYATLASGTILITEGNYIPSRPPGFPLYEAIVGLLGSISLRILITAHFIIALIFTIFINKKLEETSEKYILIFIFLTSHVFLISSFSVIDYIIGTLCGFLFLHFLEKDRFVYANVFIIMSCAIRLSNLIFLIAGIIYLFVKKEEFKKIIVVLSSLFLISLFYYPSFQLAGGICFLNLTNIDHELVPRLGRFFYKQLQFFGIIGTTILIYLTLKNFKNLKSNLPINYSLMFIFLSFQFSFLRLPTEKGHLLPALICLLFLLNNIKIKKSLLYVVLISSLLSNFISIEFLQPDIPDHATSANLGIFIEKGYILQDYENRGVKGSNFEYHLENGIFNIKQAWSQGGPNC